MKSDFEIKKIEHDKLNSVSYCADRGGIITSLVLQGKELLYLDRETLNNKALSVRGGIPILFPNAGALRENLLFPKLEQHGFVRNIGWKDDSTAKNINLKIESNRELNNVYPYQFKIETSASISKDNSFLFEQKILNTDTQQIPVSAGLHPYFKVENKWKKNIIFDFPGGQYVSDSFDSWSQGHYISIDNPAVKNIKDPMKVIIPELGSLILQVSPNYKKIWIWSLSEKDFICIEPVMRDINGLIEDPCFINIGKEETLFLKIDFISNQK